LAFFVPAVGRSAHQQQSASSLSLGERLCAAFFPFVAIAEAVLFALTNCLADICPGSDSSASRRYGTGPSTSGATFVAAKKKRSYHHHYRPFLRRGRWTSLDLRQLAHIADESRCCNSLIFPPNSWLAGSSAIFLAMPFDLTPSCAHWIEPSLGERGGGPLRALQEDQLLHRRRRPHPQGASNKIRLFFEINKIRLEFLHLYACSCLHNGI
jgi:hypothetical protein